jgi:hypothetical protein
MSSAVMMERTGVGVPGMSVPGVGTPTVGAPTGVPGGVNYLVVPRGTVRFEKCTGGFKIYCTCDDKTACSMVQNLCTMLAGGMCSCCVTYNGLTCCCCNFTMGMCKCEMTDAGVCFTCTSGDTPCCQMLQSCCDCVCAMVEAGCCCCVCLSGTPVCCGTCDSSKSPSKGKSGR